MLEDRRSDAEFIINLTINHPPYMTVTSQYIRDDHDMDVQHFVTCERTWAKNMYVDAYSWKGYFHGSISHLDQTGSQPGFFVTIPIFNQDGDLETQIVQPGAFFLTNADILFRWLAGPLEKRRVHDLLRKKYGPKNGPKE